MTTKTLKNMALHISTLAAYFVLLCLGAAAEAGTIASGRLEWTALGLTSFEAGGDIYPFTITGPGTLVVTLTISPYYARDNYSSRDGLLQYDNDGWKILKSESWFDERPRSAFTSDPQPDGSIRVYKSRIEYQIPAQTFSRKFHLIEPKKCGLADCSRRAAAAAFTAEFIPQGQAPAGNSGAAAGPAASTGLERDIDRPGMDLQCVFPSPSAAACQSLCQGTGACMAFTWVKPGHMQQAPFNGNSICCMKKEVPQARQDDCCISGMK